MENENEPAFRDTGPARNGDDRPQPGQRGIRRSIRPGTSVPDTFLVAEMADGSLVLHGWRDGPSAYLMVEDTGPLRRELAAAFGSKNVPTPDAEGEPR